MPPNIFFPGTFRERPRFSRIGPRRHRVGRDRNRHRRQRKRRERHGLAGDATEAIVASHELRIKRNDARRRKKVPAEWPPGRDLLSAIYDATVARTKPELTTPDRSSQLA
jgi:hypothetical protein